MKTVYPPTNTVCGGYNYPLIIIKYHQIHTLSLLMLNGEMLKIISVITKYLHYLVIVVYINHCEIKCNFVDFFSLLIPGQPYKSFFKNDFSCFYH